jgi:gluconokinase
MANGVPLTDEDRWDWLITLRDAAINVLSTPVSSNSQLPSGVIMSCSALKLKYRDVMRVAAYDHPAVRIHFIYLKAEENTLLERVSGRESHYMKGSMVHSQFEALEDPTDERDVIPIDVATTPDEVQKRALDAVAKELAAHR